MINLKMINKKAFRLLIIITIGLFVASCSSLPQKKSINEEYGLGGPIVDLADGGNFKEAREAAGKKVEANPEDPTAHYEMGYVILAEKTKDITPLLTKDEDIFKPSVKYTRDTFATGIIPKNIAMEVAQHWRKSLQLDASNKKLHLTLCNLYANSLMSGELKSQFRAMKRSFAEEKLVYTMFDYAEILHRRERYDLAMNICNTIAFIYPNEGGLYSDMAAISIQNGNLPDAMNNINAAFIKAKKDAITCHNYFLINMAVGNYTKAILGLKNIEGGTLWKFYEGLNLYYLGKPEYKTVLQDYIALSGKGDESNEVDIAKFLVSSDNKDDYESYMKSLLGKKWVNHIILARRAMKKFPNEMEPYLLFARIMAYYKNFWEADQTFKKIEGKGLAKTYHQKSDVNYYYAWVLQSSNLFGKANNRWLKLLDDADFYKKSAACYFLGMNQTNVGAKKAAMDTFRKVSGSSGSSKFAYFCREYVDAYEANKAADAKEAAK